MADEGFQPAPPYHLVDNENSLIDVTDLVFVDAISTGYSRTVAGRQRRAVPRPAGRPARLRRIHQRVPQDLQPLAVAEVPDRRELRHHPLRRPVAGLQTRTASSSTASCWSRRCSPTRRSSPSPQNDVAYVPYFPTYAATAWYHKKLPPICSRRPQAGRRIEARAFAPGEYMTALMKGNSLGDAEHKAMAQKTRAPDRAVRGLHRTRQPADRARPLPQGVAARPAADPRPPRRSLHGDRPRRRRRTEEFDPSNTALQGPTPRSSGLREERPQMGERPPLRDQRATFAVDLRQNRYMDMTEPLRQTMARNPFLKVFVAAGYYDMATPLLGSEFNFWHLATIRRSRERVSFGYYEAGHMIYIRPSAHKALKNDIAKFIQSAAGGRPHTQAP